jgi:hypothetical protein
MTNEKERDSTNSHAPVRILSISDDDGLRYSRELLLLNDGYDTESVTSDTVLSVVRVRSFDAAVICRSVDSKRAMTLIEMLIRYNPQMRIVNMASLDDNEPHAIDQEIASEPELFLEALRELCNDDAAIRKSFHASHGA